MLNFPEKEVDLICLNNQTISPDNEIATGW